MPLISSVIGGSIVAIINYWFDVKKKKEELKEEFKRKAYGEFIDMTRSFLNDPNLSKEEIIERQKEFIEKYYNEIMVSAPKDVIKLIEDFFETVSITYANEDEKTKAIDKILRAMRKDLGLDEVSDLKRLFKAYTPNIEKINEEKSWISNGNDVNGLWSGYCIACIVVETNSYDPAVDVSSGGDVVWVGRAHEWSVNLAEPCIYCITVGNADSLCKHFLPGTECLLKLANNAHLLPPHLVILSPLGCATNPRKTG